MAERILVIDDETLILTAVEKTLSRVGYVVVKAQNIAELEAALEGPPFALVIADIYMKEGPSRELVEKVRKHSPSVKVLMMSGSQKAGSDGNFIEKPFSIEGLRKIVGDTLHDLS